MNPTQTISNYAKKVSELLRLKGKLVGLLFSLPLNDDRPPFGGDKNEYCFCFKPYFKIEIIEPAFNSILSRENHELFIKFIKK